MDHSPIQGGKEASPALGGENPTEAHKVQRRKRGDHPGRFHNAAKGEKEDPPKKVIGEKIPQSFQYVTTEEFNILDLESKGKAKPCRPVLSEFPEVLRRYVDDPGFEESRQKGRNSISRCDLGKEGRLRGLRTEAEFDCGKRDPEAASSAMAEEKRGKARCPLFIRGKIFRKKNARINVIACANQKGGGGEGFAKTGRRGGGLRV